MTLTFDSKGESFSFGFLGYVSTGRGIHPTNTEGSYKKEGDGKSPAGIFSLGSAFGFAPSSEMQQLKIGYLCLNESIEAVDDPISRYYNRIVDRREVIPDWRSSEKMGEEPLYALARLCDFFVGAFHNLLAPRGLRFSKPAYSSLASKVSNI